MSTNYKSWMSKYKNIPLNLLSIPGSHDAGMYKISWHTNLAMVFPSDNAQTQSKRIQHQLEAGVRFFDIRPGWMVDDDNKTAYAGHFGDSKSGTVGCTGGDLHEILSDVLGFLKECGSHEVIILKFSHYFQVTNKTLWVDNTIYDDDNDENKHEDIFNDFKQWLVNYVSDFFSVKNDDGSITHWLYDNNSGKRLTQCTPNEITKVEKDNNPKVIAVFDKINATITMPKQCYHYADMVHDSGKAPNDVKVYPYLPEGDLVQFDCYSNTNDYDTMSSSTKSEGQLAKFVYSPYHTGDYYLFSWTLTMKNVDHIIDKIEDLAYEANGHLKEVVDDMISNNLIRLSNGPYRMVPNVIYVDYSDIFVTDVCITVNDSLHF